MEKQQGNGEIVVYQPDEITRLEVMVENETVWLNRHILLNFLESTSQQFQNTYAIYIRVGN